MAGQRADGGRTPVTTDLRVAITVAGWILSFLASLVVTGTVVPDGALARRAAARWWYVAPTVTAVSSAVSTALLLGWTSRSLCGAAAALASSIFVVARPHQRLVPQPGWHGAEWSDGSSSRRLVLLAVAVVTYTVAVYVAMRGGV